MKLIIVKGVEHLLGEGVWNPLRKGCPTLYMYMFHNYKLITNNLNIPFTHDSDSMGKIIQYFMPSINYLVFFFRVSNLFEYVKWEVSLICTDESHRHQRHEPLEGSETCSPENFEILMF